MEHIASLLLLAEDALHILIIGAESGLVEEGKVLYHAGEPAHTGYVIQQGSFNLTLTDGHRSKAVTVGPGTLLGELALLSETTQPATAMALVPSSLLRIQRKLFHKVLDGYEGSESVARRAGGIRACMLASGKPLLPGVHTFFRSWGYVLPRWA